MRFLDASWQDVRYAARSLARYPVVSGAVIVTLLLGIGLNTAVFSALQGMFFRSRVEKDPETFVQLLPEGRAFGSSTAEYQACRGARSISDVAAWSVLSIRVEDDRTRDLALLVTGNFFSLYGLDRAPGQEFDARSVVISEELWRGRFHASPSMIGSAIRLNGHPYTVVGIAPAKFPGRVRGPGIWIPYTMRADFDTSSASRPWLIVEGRLRPGFSRPDAAAEVSAIANRQVSLTNGSFAQIPAVRTTMLLVTPLVMGVMALLLLIVCSNVTLLLLARAAARRREIAIRRALGADRWRLLRMLLTEGLLLGGVAGALSAGLARWIPVAFRKVLWRGPYYPVNPDWTVFLFLSVIALAAGCMAGLAPALESFRGDLTPAMRLPTRDRWSMRDLQMTFMVAASVVLVAGAALFVRAQIALASRPEMAEMAARFRTMSGMTLFLGIIALVLATIGVYGAVAFAVSQRSRELAIRVALGATRRDIVRCVLRPGMRPIMLGLLTGLPLALTGSVVLSQLLRRSPVAFNAWDPLSYAAVCVILGVASLIAMLRPAWRAAKVDPAAALRED